MSVEKNGKVYDTFQKISAGYDRQNNLISLGRHWAWKRFFVRALSEGLPEGGRILDLCCGTGDISLLLEQSGKNFRITGADFSPNMLKIAAGRLGGSPNVELVLADALCLPFPDNTFDCAAISFGLRNTRDYLAVLRELERVVKPGGLVGCLDSSYPDSLWVRPFYKLYFKYLMPVLGGGIKYRKEYRWLYHSTERFVSKRELLELFRKAGLTGRKYKSFMFGACACHLGYKKRRNTSV